ncbi:MAG TPA: (2Fe-2S)-binding protein [Pseudomonas xinjiangensis]|uniref:(2Fe-2S)-binding protein n=2 Tax=root TaxID=1 RepID=A0A7V1BN51_9GAMM|nr:(2Fe-2S)-binding protein [Halopseudomonas xinjiangensis]HEC48071.1 (2Fe-2S)-binding protein [Halopseudomonas xinjiangensis]
MANNAWWASALSEAVNNEKPLAVVCNGEELALFRDRQGQAFALEDRCPHRRVPLSLGCVVESGIQCGYHGWTFDGASGACTTIPNLHANERVPARYAARPYPVAERNGFVHVWLGEDEPNESVPAATYQPEGREYTGAGTISILHEEYLAAMLDGPHCLISFDAVKMTDFFLGDPRLQNDHLVLDRGAVWSTRVLPPQFVVDYPLIVRTSVPVRGGDIRVELLTEQEAPLCTVFIASGANRRGTTSVCWRGFLHQSDVSHVPLRWRAARKMKRPPFRVHTQVDGKLLATLLEAPSRDLARLRDSSIIPLRAAV